MAAIEGYGCSLAEPNQPFEVKALAFDDVADDEAVIEVAGCGLCHTDIGFYAGDVRTKHELPLILGHEISGRVVKVGSKYSGLEGKNVIVPAVLPCGQCDLCAAGRENICQQQKMPGNDFNGGFASHIKVPAQYLCPLPDDIGDIDLADLSVIADAVTTPYQAMLRSGLKKGDLAIVVGVGGLGNYMVQHAKNAGASVIAIDIDAGKLEASQKMGADHIVNTSSLSEKDVKKEVRKLVKENSLSPNRWKVFEMSGTAGGQATAFSLLSFAGALGIIGFTMDKVNVRLSNAMAFDADLFGSWACRPEYYPDVVKDVLDGRINLKANVEKHPLKSINEVIELAHEHKLDKRVVFVP
jgi:6-hydroxycyclohex-1-ene-1-carbonyl-CoA dehydrogenase